MCQAKSELHGNMPRMGGMRRMIEIFRDKISGLTGVNVRRTVMTQADNQCGFAIVS